jgi:hypothetical protein
MKNTLIINAVGDISFNGKNEKNPSMDVFSRLTNILKDADITIGNLENPLLECGEPVPGKCALRGSTGWAAVLKESGINALSLANNHMLDYGAEGITSTIRALKDAKLPYAGAGMNALEASAPLFLDVKDMRIAVLARTSVIVSSPSYATDTTPGVAFLDADEIKNTIGNCKKKSDLVILSLHWGIEHYLYPSPFQKALARELIGYGADLIIGHHPHVLQGTEKIGKGIAAYSLGNFVFDDIRWSFVDKKGQSQDRLVRLTGENRKTGILKVQISEENEFSYEFIPAIISPGGAIETDEDRDRLKQYHRLCSSLHWPFYKPFWKMYSIKQEWVLRIMPMLAGKFTWKKIKKLRLKHLKELVDRMRRAARLSAEKTTNPYE